VGIERLEKWELIYQAQDGEDEEGELSEDHVVAVVAEVVVGGVQIGLKLVAYFAPLPLNRNRRRRHDCDGDSAKDRIAIVRRESCVRKQFRVINCASGDS